MPVKSSPKQLEEKLKLALWSIERLDRLRASAQSRAAMVVSADAILLAGITFLVNEGFSGSSLPHVTGSIYNICAFFSFVLVVLSVVYAANTIVFIWRRTRAAVGVEDLPMSELFHPSDMAGTFKNFEKFQKAFLAASTEKMLTQALGELMQVTLAHHKRYKSLRTALRLLLLAIIPFLLCLLMLTSDFLR